MKKLNRVENENMLKEVKGGWDRCAMCGTTVRGGFWTKYGHCVKHAFNSVLSVADLVGTCFGVFK